MKEDLNGPSLSQWQKISESFNLITIEGDSETPQPETSELYSPDGGYIPRVFFLNPGEKTPNPDYTSGKYEIPSRPLIYS